MVWLRRFRTAVERIARVYFTPGVLFASGTVATQDYSPIVGMSTLARFPWVWVCVQAITTDLSGLPIVAVRTPPGPGHKQDRELVDDPVLRLLERPNAAEDGPTFVGQLVADRITTGNAYIWAPDLSAGVAPVAIYRLHPDQTKIVPGPMGIAESYTVTDPGTGTIRTIPAGEVIHIRGISWQNGASGLYGESPIRPLHDDLVADLGARTTAAALTKKGRPDVMFSVKGGIGGKIGEEIRRRWEEAIRQLHGAFVVGEDVTATPLSWSPKDFGELDRNTIVRDKVLSVFGVPPTRANITTANYGASRQEYRVYWESLQARGREFERAFSRLAAPGVRVEFDYSAVEALQVSYTERLHRVQTWVALGADPNEAAAYEGFDEAPAMKLAGQLKPTQNIDRQPEEPQADRQNAMTPAEAVARHLRTAAAVLGELSAEVDPGLIPRFLAVELFAGLRLSGLGEVEARWWADEIAATTVERWRMDPESACDPSRAPLIARHLEAA